MSHKEVSGLEMYSCLTSLQALLVANTKGTANEAQLTLTLPQKPVCHGLISLLEEDWQFSNTNGQF